MIVEPVNLLLIVGSDLFQFVDLHAVVLKFASQIFQILFIIGYFSGGFHFVFLSDRYL